MTKDEKTTMLAALEDFADASVKLLRAWKDGGEACREYPFNESFGDLVHGILAWRYATEEDFAKEGA